MYIKIYGRDITIFAVYSSSDDSNQKKMNSRQSIQIQFRPSAIGKKYWYWDIFMDELGLNIMGQHEEDAVNDNGTRLLGICECYSFHILNAFYLHKNILKCSYIICTHGSNLQGN